MAHAVLPTPNNYKVGLHWRHCLLDAYQIDFSWTNRRPIIWFVTRRRQYQLQNSGLSSRRWRHRCMPDGLRPRCFLELWPDDEDASCKPWRDVSPLSVNCAVFVVQFFLMTTSCWSPRSYSRDSITVAGTTVHCWYLSLSVLVGSSRLCQMLLPTSYRNHYPEVIIYHAH